MFGFLLKFNTCSQKANMHGSLIHICFVHFLIKTPCLNMQLNRPRYHITITKISSCFIMSIQPYSDAVSILCLLWGLNVYFISKRVNPYSCIQEKKMKYTVWGISQSMDGDGHCQKGICYLHVYLCSFNCKIVLCRKLFTCMLTRKLEEC